MGKDAPNVRCFCLENSIHIYCNIYRKKGQATQMGQNYIGNIIFSILLGENARPKWSFVCKQPWVPNADRPSAENN